MKPKTPLEWSLIQEGDNVTLRLPWPPSVNHYWRHERGRFHVAKPGRAYRVNVAATAHGCKTKTGRLKVVVFASPPDKRVRDLDNLLKAVLDALQYAGVYRNDSQIDRIEIERQGVSEQGGLKVRLEPWP